MKLFETSTTAEALPILNSEEIYIYRVLVCIPVTQEPEQLLHGPQLFHGTSTTYTKPYVD
jgi:hypothetical protein